MRNYTALLRIIIILILIPVSSFCKAQSPGELISTLDSTSNDTLKVSLYNELFLVFEYSDTLKAKNYLHKALKLASKMQYKAGLAKTYKHIGFLMEDQGNYQGAFSNYERLIRISEELKDKEGIATAYNSLGNLSIHEGNYLKGVEYYNQALKIAEKINDSKLVFKAANNLGICYNNLRQDSLSLESYKRALEVVEKLDIPSWKAMVYDNIGVTYQTSEKLDLALQNHKRALDIQLELNNKLAIASCYENLGIVFALKGDSAHSSFESAIENYNKALAIYHENGYRRKESNCIFNMATLYIRQEKFDTALSLAKECHKINLELGGLDDLENSYGILAECYGEMGEYEEAYKNHLDYKNIFDSVHNSENVKKITAMEMRHEFDKIRKEKEFEQRKKDILEKEKTEKATYSH